MDLQPILVIDDDPVFRSAVAETLESEGYYVESASNGLEGLEAIRKTRYALIVLDLRMPTIDGWKFARMLEASDVHVPLLVITAALNPQSSASEIGATGYLAKPLDMTRFIETVDNIVKHHSVPQLPTWHQQDVQDWYTCSLGTHSAIVWRTSESEWGGLINRAYNLVALQSGFPGQKDAMRWALDKLITLQNKSSLRSDI